MVVGGWCARQASSQLAFTRAQQQHRHVARLVESGEAHRGIDLTEERNDSEDGRCVHGRLKGKGGGKQAGESADGQPYAACQPCTASLLMIA